MPAPKKLTHNTPLLVVRRHLTHTRRELLAYPLLEGFAPKFDGLLVTWTKIFEMDMDLQDQVDATLSLQRSIDHGLNRIARRVAKEVTLLVGDDPEAPLRKLYFGNKPLHAFIRPVLHGQLASMHNWPDPLAKSGHKALEDIGLELAPILPKADASVAAEGLAIKKRDEFRLVGARMLYIDEVNTARRETYTAATTLQQKHPELTAEIVEGLFRRDRARDDDPTIEGIEEEIAELEALLGDRKKLLAQLQKEQEEALAQQKQAEMEEKKKKLAQLHKELEAKQQEAAALAAELDDA